MEKHAERWILVSREESVPGALLARRPCLALARYPGLSEARKLRRPRRALAAGYPLISEARP